MLWIQDKPSLYHGVRGIKGICSVRCEQIGCVSWPSGSLEPAIIPDVVPFRSTRLGAATRTRTSHTHLDQEQRAHTARVRTFAAPREMWPLEWRCPYSTALRRAKATVMAHFACQAHRRLGAGS